MYALYLHVIIQSTLELKLKVRSLDNQCGTILSIEGIWEGLDGIFTIKFMPLRYKNTVMKYLNTENAVTFFLKYTKKFRWIWSRKSALNTSSCFAKYQNSGRYFSKTNTPSNLRLHTKQWIAVLINTNTHSSERLHTKQWTLVLDLVIIYLQGKGYVQNGKCFSKYQYTFKPIVTYKKVNIVVSLLNTNIPSSQKATYKTVSTKTFLTLNEKILIIILFCEISNFLGTYLPTFIIIPKVQKYHKLFFIIQKNFW